MFASTPVCPAEDQSGGHDLLHEAVSHSADPSRWMAEALSLAQAMQGRVWPNPPVGCVIVRDGRIVGRGQTQPGGRPHAERMALGDAGALAQGGSLYVTLEPCCHWGKTPPCADAIIAAGVREVHASLQDPDPRVNGGGFAKLRAAGIDVSIGSGAQAAYGIMEGFFTRVALGRPLVTLTRQLARASEFRAIFDRHDAVLASDGPNLSLMVRTATGLEIVQIDADRHPAELAQSFGVRGLTSILIAGSDSVADLWRAAGLVDHDPITRLAL